MRVISFFMGVFVTLAVLSFVFGYGAAYVEKLLP